jgi:esterase/lipase superfamily enzyme
VGLWAIFFRVFLEELWRRRSALLGVLLLVGCAPKLMPTPNLYATARQPLFEDLRPELQGTRMDVLYVTDRAPEDDGSGSRWYGYERSASVRYGSAILEIGSDMSWDELVNYSTKRSPRYGRPILRIDSVTELGRLPATPYHFKIQAQGDVKLAPEAVAEWNEALARARSELVKRLALTRRKEVFVFVHGVGNSFQDHVRTVGEAWHFLGREGVPIAYTWPSGRGGLLFYAYDRESGEFTIFHLKQLFELLASVPEVEAVHVLSHSRGTDVVMTALRELVIETRAAGHNPRERFKIDNLILLAPDLDFSVVMQRLVAEALGPAFGRITIYANADDDAIAAAHKLFGSRLRLGALQRSELTDEQRDTLEAIANLDIVSYQGITGGSFGHGYFRVNPAVSSDVLARLRYGSLPGEGMRAGLKQTEEGSNFWIIDDHNLEFPPEGAAH